LSILSKKVLAVTIDYIGPSSESFLQRQATHHLNGLKFDDLDRQHLPELAKWVKVSAGLLIDKGRAAELAEKVLHC
jgi:folate-binding Fe-S cluster repair protein YgfZ